jgi:anti-sigma factor RsiW
MNMKCEEIQPLHGAYLDSELDARTTAEIQQHLAACPDCARAFAAEAKLNAQITTGLKRGQRTAALWAQIEQRVSAAAKTESSPRRTTQAPPRMPWWREMLWPCPQAWAGLATVWMVMLVASFAAREPATTTEAHQVSPPSRQTRELLQKQRQMLAELDGLAEQLATEQPGGVAPQPRSQRSEQPSNT